jgi:hypothetical protein
MKLSDWPTKNVVRRYALTMIAEGRGEAVSPVDLQRRVDSSDEIARRRVRLANLLARRWLSQSQYWQEEADRKQAFLQEEAERSQRKGLPG